MAGNASADKPLVLVDRLQLVDGQALVDRQELNPRSLAWKDAISHADGRGNFGLIRPLAAKGPYRCCLDT